MRRIERFALNTAEQNRLIEKGCQRPVKNPDTRVYEIVRNRDRKVIGTGRTPYLSYKEAKKELHG